MMRHYPEGTIVKDNSGEFWVIGETVLDINDGLLEAQGMVGEDDFQMYCTLSKYVNPQITKRVDVLRELEANYALVLSEGSIQ